MNNKTIEQQRNKQRQAKATNQTAKYSKLTYATMINRELKQSNLNL